MTEKKITNRRVVWLASFTLLTALVWVALDSYHELVKRGRIEGVEQLLTPLEPELEKEVLEKIIKRKEYSIQEAESFLKRRPTPVEPTPTEVLSETAEEETTTELQPTEATVSGKER